MSVVAQVLLGADYANGLLDLNNTNEATAVLLEVDEIARKGNIGPTLLAASWTLARARWALQKNDAAQITATSALLKTLVDDWRAVNADSEWHGEALWWLSQTERALGETTAATQHRDAARAMLAKSRLPGLQRLAAK